MAPDESSRTPPGRGAIVVTALVTAVVVGVVAYSLGRMSAPGNPVPGNTGAEAGFARDMQVHHIQGVEMALIIRDRTEDEDVRLLAYDIATTQGHQAGQLYGWLAEWGLRQAGSEPPMTWMMRPGGPGVEGDSEPHAMGALMPGMATRAQMVELSEASGVEAERLFLSLMIAHHQGALEMAEAVRGGTDHPEVLTFANAVLVSQASEIDLMTRMLAERGE
jgi:uncharacterized protein (DUF305 family)